LELGNPLYHGKTEILSALTTGGVIRKLEKQIKKQARRKKADLAVINSQFDCFGFLINRSYEYVLYKFKE
jgi:hypothetical protein